MKKIPLGLFFVYCMVLNTAAQNLVENPSFENLPSWDSLWHLSLTDPSSPSAVVTPIITDAHEGITSVELSNTVNNKWTYFYTDSTIAPINFLANKSYEVKGWLRSTEEAKNVDFSIFWNGSINSRTLYSGIPDPVSDPDWFMAKDTITPTTDFNDVYLRLGLRATKSGPDIVGKLLIDDFSVIRLPDNNETEITAFSIPEQAVASTISDSTATIVVEVPYGTDLTSLTPDLITLSRGATVSPLVGIPQDFTSPVVYTVTAQNEVTARNWTVTVVYQPNTVSDITGFSFTEELIPPVIDNLSYTVSAEVLFGTDLTMLAPSISLSYGATVTPDSGVISDFTNPVTYTVTAEDGISTRDWTVTVTEAPISSENDIISFSFAEQAAPALINPFNHTIVINVPFATDVSTLIPSIDLSPGAFSDPPTGVTNNFISTRLYSVVAQDGISIQIWAVTVNILPNDETNILTFDLGEQDSPATIDLLNHTVNIDVLYGTDPSSLVPTITVSEGATPIPASGMVVDFSGPVSYLIIAQNGIASQNWIIYVHIQSCTETDIVSFTLAEEVAPAAIDTANHTVYIEVPYGTDPSGLVPTIAVSDGASIDPASGVATDFSGLVTYAVTAQDSISMQNWNVSVHVRPNTETDIVSFTLVEQVAPAAIDTANHTVNIEVPYGTDLASLEPTIAVSDGASIAPASRMATDFSGPVNYVVTAQDGISMQNWNISIHVRPNTETDIVSFTLTEQVAPSAIDTVNHTVYIEVPYGTDPSILMPTIAVSDGATIAPASGMVTDFTAPVTYVVTAQDAISSQNWNISVHVQLNTETDIITFTLAEQTGPPSIDKRTLNVAIEVWKDTDVTALAPIIIVSQGATINPASEIAVDFTNEVDYTVTAENGISTQIWSVNVSLDPAVGLRRIDKNQSLIYPNPATDIVQINLDEPAIISLHDLTGKAIFMKSFEKGIRDISIDDFSSGIYVIHIVQGSIRLTQKLIILQ